VEERERKLQALKKHLAEGIADLDSGRFVTPEQMVAAIKEQAV
jgi:predicted transcriptional regulator